MADSFNIYNKNIRRLNVINKTIISKQANKYLRDIYIDHGDTQINEDTTPTRFDLNFQIKRERHYT